jgi:hypothetical protein
MIPNTRLTANISILVVAPTRLAHVIGPKFSVFQKKSFTGPNITDQVKAPSKPPSTAHMASLLPWPSAIHTVPGKYPAIPTPIPMIIPPMIIPGTKKLLIPKLGFGTKR